MVLHLWVHPTICSTYLFKNSTYKLTHAVQTHVIQESTVIHFLSFVLISHGRGLNILLGFLECKILILLIIMNEFSTSVCFFHLCLRYWVELVILYDPYVPFSINLTLIFIISHLLLLGSVFCFCFFSSFLKRKLNSLLFCIFKFLSERI